MEEMKGCSYAAGGVGGGAGRSRQGSISGVIRTMGRVVSSSVHITLCTMFHYCHIFIFVEQNV